MRRTTASPPPWRVQSARTRTDRSEQSILLAATELLTQARYEEITIAAVARRAGVGSATVYNRFGSRGRLLACAVFNPEVGRLRAAAFRDLRREDAGACVSSYLRRAALLLARNRRVTEGFLQALGEVPEPERQLSAAAIMALPRPLAEILAAGQQRGTVRADINAYEMGGVVVTMLIYHVVRYPSASGSRSAEVIGQMVASGIAPPGR